MENGNVTFETVDVIYRSREQTQLRFDFGVRSNHEPSRGDNRDSDGAGSVEACPRADCRKPTPNRKAGG
jgi:hypothetical protein